VLCLLAWYFVFAGAAMGMSAWQMTTFALFPHASSAGRDMQMATSTGLVVLMWWVMMIAMMTPSATPAILLYASVYRHHLKQGNAPQSLGPTAVFALGYLLVWLAFSVAATGVQRLLENSGLLSTGMMNSRSRWLSAAVLLAAGLYQFSPFKDRCLTQCRSPAAFFTRHWRPHAVGALRLGALHGAWCVGCCALLMALLFVGGVMNLAWIAALTVLVMAEKLLPGGPWVGRAAGVLLLVWGIATLSI
jgi:predicted metal-binding membrane protein